MTWQYFDLLTLVVLYVNALLVVDLLHAGYMVFFIVFTISQTVRFNCWPLLVVYTWLCIVALYLTQLKLFDFLRLWSGAQFVGLIEIGALWSQLWLHVAILALSALCYRFRAGERTALFAFTSYKAFVTASLYACVGVILWGGLQNTLASSQSAVSAFSGVYLILVFVTVLIHQCQTEGTTVHIRRLLYWAASYAGVVLIVQVCVLGVPCFPIAFCVCSTSINSTLGRSTSACTANRTPVPTPLRFVSSLASTKSKTTMAASSFSR